MGLKIAQASMSSVNANAHQVVSAMKPSERVGTVQKKASEILDKSLPGLVDYTINAATRYGPSIAAAASKAYGAYKAIRGGLGPTAQGSNMPMIEDID